MRWHYSIAPPCPQADGWAEKISSSRATGRSAVCAVGQKFGHPAPLFYTYTIAVRTLRPTALSTSIRAVAGRQDAEGRRPRPADSVWECSREAEDPSRFPTPPGRWSAVPIAGPSTSVVCSVGVCHPGERGCRARCVARSGRTGDGWRRAEAADRLRSGFDWPPATPSRCGRGSALHPKSAGGLGSVSCRSGRLSPQFSAASLGARQDAPALLTNRQIDILSLLAEQLPDRGIAQRLVLSPLTVKMHTQRIYHKLGVHDRRAAVVQARRLGLI